MDMKLGTLTFFCGEDYIPKVTIRDDRPQSYGWDATFTVGPISIFLRNQLQVHELVQSINESYRQYLSIGEPSNG